MAPGGRPHSGISNDQYLIVLGGDCDDDDDDDDAYAYAYASCAYLHTYTFFAGVWVPIPCHQGLLHP